MSGTDSDNELDFLLEKSIDDQIKTGSESVNHANNFSCPFAGGKNKNQRKLKSTKFNRVDEKFVFNKRLLPEGWVRFYHESGMYYYFHVATRVVTWSMPYQLQLEPGKVHRVPVRSIPCLSYLVMKNEGSEWDKLVNIKKMQNSELNNSAVSEENVDNNEADKEENKEEGELESSDEEGTKNDKDENQDYLPKKYRINKDDSKSGSSQTLKRPANSQKLDQVNAKKPKLEENPAKDGNVAENNSDKQDDTKPTLTEPIDYTAKFLEPQQLRNFCDRLFTFRDEYKYWPAYLYNKWNRLRPNQNKNNSNKIVPVVKNTDPNQVPQTCTKKIKVPNKNIFIEIAGRSLSCILNMYCQHAYGVTPNFNYHSSKTGIHDFEVQCIINKTPYGIGEGKTKKLAKQKSVQKTLEILIPGFSQYLLPGEEQKTDDQQLVSAGSGAATAGSTATGTATNDHASLTSSQLVTTEDTEDEIYNIFDSMEITDPRVLSYCTKLNTMTPNDIFMECINRHCIPDHQIVSKIEKKDQHNLFKFRVGDKQVEVVCENKREGRQLAAQYMLASMHPHIQSWGGILRLYGPGSKPVKRFDMQEMQNLLLEDRGGVKNNLIRLLHRKMLELHEEWKDSSDKAKAKFKVPFQNIPVIVFHPDATKEKD